MTHCWKIREVPSSPRCAPVPVDVLPGADQAIKSELMSAFWHGTDIKNFWINPETVLLAAPALARMRPTIPAVAPWDALLPSNGAVMGTRPVYQGPNAVRNRCEPGLRLFSTTQGPARQTRLNGPISKIALSFSFLEARNHRCNAAKSDIWQSFFLLVI